MRVLVTGAAGFIGSSVVDRLLSEGHAVLGVDNFNAFYDPEIKHRNLLSAMGNPAFELVRGDILDAALIDDAFQRFSPDRVLHLAAWAGVRPSIELPALYQKVNVEGTTTLLEACRTHGVDKFVFASSSSVYGDREAVPFRETDSVDHPISPYAATKKAGELLCYTWHHLFGLNAHCLRFFTVYGPRQRPEMAIHKFVRTLAAGKPLTLFGDGSSSRDYTFIDDIVDGVLASLDRVSGYEIINLGESKTTTLSELVGLIGDAMGIEPAVEHLPMQAGDVTRTFADVSRAHALLGYAPKVGMAEGVGRFVAWYREIAAAASAASDSSDSSTE
jgi:UDP-glucuronate 4-epimerase